MVKTWSRQRGAQRAIAVPMFAGYVFVRCGMNKRSYIDIVKLRGVVRLLGEAWDRLTPVPDDEISTIRRIVETDVPVFPYPYLHEGQQVRITDGPLKGVEGVLVQSKPRKGLLVVSVDLLQRSVAVEVDGTDVVPRSPACHTSARRTGARTVHAASSLGASWRLIMTMAAGALFVPRAADGQPALEVVPSVAFATVLDDNVFLASTNEEADVISRLTSGLDARYERSLLTMNGHYRLDSERFTDHPSLTDMNARQDAAVDVRSHRFRNAILGADAAVTTTHTPGELNLLSGLAVGRAHASRIVVHPSLEREMGSQY